MLIAALTCFGIAVLLGLAIFFYVIDDKPIPRILSFTHGPFALLGIVFLVIETFKTSRLIAFTAIFILAALGGLTLLYKDLKRKPLPKLLVFAHAFIAFGTFLFLAVYTFIHSI